MANELRVTECVPHASRAMSPEDWSIVRSTPLFGAMSVEVVETLIAARCPRTYEKGATIFRQGTPAEAFYIILAGWVKIYRITPDGLEVVLHVFQTGETFAEPAMFLGGQYPASAETVSKARLLRIEGATFRARICERPELALSMLTSASYHLKLLVEQIEQIKFRSAAQRIAEFIVRLAPHRASGPAMVELPFEKCLLANRLGMTPGSFSRALSKLKTHGVSVDREIVRIADLGQLISFVERAREDASQSAGAVAPCSARGT